MALSCLQRVQVELCSFRRHEGLDRGDRTAAEEARPDIAARQVMSSQGTPTGLRSARSSFGRLSVQVDLNGCSAGPLQHLFRLQKRPGWSRLLEEVIGSF